MKLTSAYPISGIICTHVENMVEVNGVQFLRLSPRRRQFLSCSFDHLCGSFVHHVYFTTKALWLEMV